ncbi:MAG: C-terminal processing protease CtpA/Prc [Urechidicola sp.]|jgi:C-terminal processing protease CtpA/Prc
MNKLNFLLVVLFSISLISCNSVKKYNKTINSKHSVAELHKDVDFTFKKIKKLQPSLYWFITEEKLELKINSVKKSITKPLTSKEFFFVLSPLVSEIRQGHNSVGYPMDKYEKEELKEYKKTTNKFGLLSFENIEGKVIINKVYDSIQTLKNSELLKIDNLEVSDLLDKYNGLRSSDGFNTTFIERRKGIMLQSYYRIENPTLDSVTLRLSLNDSIFDTTFYRVKKPVEKKDSLKELEIENLSDTAKARIKKEKKKKRVFETMRGFSKLTKQYTRSYKFLEDSTVGYIKIRGFMNGPYQSLYDEFFAEIDTAGCSSIVIDLRDNLGGRLAEIHYLMKYLARGEFITMSDMESKTRIPRTKSIWSSNNKPLMVLLKTIITPFLYTYELVTSKKINGIVYHKMNASKPTEPFKNSFKGKIYVLINGNSFSASSIISTNLQGSERATIVGEETGGTFNGTVAGVFKPITLPNSKLHVQFGLGMIRAPYTESPDGFGVIPDFIILPTLEHRKKGIDTELEFVLKQIKDKKVIDKKSEKLEEELENLEEPIEDNTNKL